jgi:hypothetical protein
MQVSRPVFLIIIPQDYGPVLSGGAFLCPALPAIMIKVLKAAWLCKERGQ